MRKDDDSIQCRSFQLPQRDFGTARHRRRLPCDDRPADEAHVARGWFDLFAERRCLGAFQIAAASRRRVRMTATGLAASRSFHPWRLLILELRQSALAARLFVGRFHRLRCDRFPETALAPALTFRGRASALHLRQARAEDERDQGPHQCVPECSATRTHHDLTAFRRQQGSPAARLCQDPASLRLSPTTERHQTLADSIASIS